MAQTKKKKIRWPLGVAGPPPTAKQKKKKKKKIVGRWGSRTTPNGHGVASAALDRPIWGG
jgi:hypothetical protein